VQVGGGYHWPYSRSGGRANNLCLFTLRSANKASLSHIGASAVIIVVYMTLHVLFISAYMAESSMEDIPNFLSMDTDLSLEYFAASNYANGIASADEPWKELSDGSDSGIDSEYKKTCVVFLEVFMIASLAATILKFTHVSPRPFLLFLVSIVLPCFVFFVYGHYFSKAVLC